MQKTNCPRGSTNQAPRTNEQINRIAKESRLVTFDQMTSKLKEPANNKKHESPTPVEEEPWQTDYDHRNADRVTESVQPMLMFGFVILNQGFSHNRRVATHL